MTDSHIDLADAAVTAENQAARLRRYGPDDRQDLVPPGPDEAGSFLRSLSAVGFCPDLGRCHHKCAALAMSCFRVRQCAPLSGVFPDDRWPPELTEETP